MKLVPSVNYIIGKMSTIIDVLENILQIVGAKLGKRRNGFSWIFLVTVRRTTTSKPNINNKMEKTTPDGSVGKIRHVDGRERNVRRLAFGSRGVGGTAVRKTSFNVKM